jgi:Alanine dehydrogenase/PNT, N-terminal domain
MIFRPASGKGARVDQLSLGVISRSRKENERRLPIHPLHADRIDAGLRERVYLEHGYGERFGVPDEQLASCVAGLRTREELFAECDVILLPKPQPQDLAQMRDGPVLWGWPHCVQDEEITQLSIERRLTLIAFEAMNYWDADGSFGLHVFHLLELTVHLARITLSTQRSSGADRTATTAARSPVPWLCRRSGCQYRRAYPEIVHK